MSHPPILSIALGLTLAIACKSELDNKPAAKVGEVAAAKADDKADDKAGDKAGETKTYKVDVAGSSIGWVGSKVTGDHTGSFTAFTGEVVIAGGAPSALSLAVDTTSITSDNEKLTAHLRGTDFFDVEQFPKASFTSTSIAAAPGEAGATHAITGDLDLHGVKKSITFPAKLTIDGGSAAGEAEFTINRKDFGIEYAGMPDDLIKDDVLLKLNLRFAG